MTAIAIDIEFQQCGEILTSHSSASKAISSNLVIPPIAAISGFKMSAAFASNIESCIRDDPVNYFQHQEAHVLL